MKYRLIAAALAAFFMLPLLGVTAYAYADPEEIPDETIISEETPDDEGIPSAPVTDYPETPPRPFTPSGTGTVIDIATDSDGKIFYTIMTPDEHVFYLVIDKQRNADNVYFLNAVTVDDLMALAENPKPPQGGTVAPPPTTTDNPEQPTETPPPAEQPQGGNMGMYIVVGILVIAGGGAGWYFKIYRPKQQGAANSDEYDPSMNDTENDDTADWGDQDEGDDSPPWDEDGESGDEE